jgi:hypothetical protein
MLAIWEDIVNKWWFFYWYWIAGAKMDSDKIIFNKK